MISQYATLMAGLWTGVPFRFMTAVLSLVDPETASNWQRNVEAGASPVSFPGVGGWAAARLPFMLEFVAGLAILVVAVIAIVVAVGAVFYFTRPECSGRASQGAFTCR